MDFPLVNAVLAGVPDAPPNEASDISALKAAVQEPGLKYKEFDNVDLLPALHASEAVGNPPKEADIVPPNPLTSDHLEKTFSSKESKADAVRGFASFTKPVTPSSSGVQVKKMDEKNMKQQPLRDVFAFLAGRQSDARPATSLRDIFR
ncbi:hypothetical protein [Acetobacter orientalis]|uniref:hypothetical protein n=1 Tax=Acetobacter orientalis TaxID=146474 RepID=UPI0039E8405C